MPVAWLLLGIVAAGGSARAAGPSAAPLVLRLSKDRPETSIFAPLEDVVVQIAPDHLRGRLRVRDGRGEVYVDVAQARAGLRFTVAGALGTHRLEFEVGRGPPLRLDFEVDASTALATGSGRFDGLFRRLVGQLREAQRSAFVDGDNVRYVVPGLRGNQQVARALRYFEADVGSYLDLILRYQREDGSLFSSFALDDHFDPFTGTYPGVHLERDLYGPRYTGRSRDGRTVFHRVPIEPDIEALAVEYAFAVWQARGDDRWLAAALPRLERAVEALLRDPLRFSSEHGLLQRGFTIDFWNLQHPAVLALHPSGNRNLAGWVDLQWLDADTPKGIAHGDNSALYAAALALARLQAHQGDPGRAAYWTRVAEDVRANLLRTSWNGTFFRHFVPVRPLPEPLDLGANEARQLSFSNALAIRRELTTHAQAVAILDEYRHRRERLPEGVLAEWFTIDPPYRDGFAYMAPGEYANGGVTPALAGELARAAFAHGRADYGADILRRVRALAERTGRLSAMYYPTPQPASWQAETFFPIDLRAIANRDLRGDGALGFIGHPDNDLRSFPVGRQHFLGKPFEVVDPRENGGRAAVVLWAEGSPGPSETTLAGVQRKARSIYFLHSAGNPRLRARIGEYEIAYEDGTRVRLPLLLGRNIGTWWAAEGGSEWRIAWRGRNAHVSNLTVGVWGWNNPQPDKQITSITARALNGGRIQLLGITMSSAPVQFPRGEPMRGFPDAWGVAPVIEAFIEGVAGVRDQHRLFEQVRVAPHWAALDEQRAAVTVRYAGSPGYVAYRWEHFPADRRLAIEATGSGPRLDFHVPLPASARAPRVSIRGRAVPHALTRVEDILYLDFTAEGAAAVPIDVRY